MKQTESKNQDEYLSPKQVAEILGMKLGGVYNQVAKGMIGIPYYRFGKLIKFKKSDVEKYLEECRVEPKQQERNNS